MTVVSALSATATGIDAPAITFPADGVVTVTVTSRAGAVDGVVMLSVDAGPPLTQTLTGGSATFTLPSPSGGAHALNVSYPRQLTFEGSSASGVLVVNRGTPEFANLLPVFIAPGQTPAILSGTILAASAAPPGNVTATVNGVSQATPIADDGSFLVRFDSASLAPGRYPVTYSYAGSASFNSASAAAVLSVVNGTTATFSNPAAIAIPDNAPGVPYPSTIEVAGGGEAVLKATVTLTGVTHTFLGDVEMVLVAPDGATTTLFWDPNDNSASVTSASYTFDDAGPPLPPSSESGTYRPTQTSTPPPARRGSRRSLRHGALHAQPGPRRRHLEPLHRGPVQRRHGLHLRRLEPHPDHGADPVAHRSTTRLPSAAARRVPLDQALAAAVSAASARRGTRPPAPASGAQKRSFTPSWICRCW